VEAALRREGAERIGRSPSWVEAVGVDAHPGSENFGVDEAFAAPWRHPLVDPIAGPSFGRPAHDCCARVATRGAEPHRLERYMRSHDPDFETKAADVIGLYVDPPQHAAVFGIDEKTTIQALDRLDPRGQTTSINVRSQRCKGVMGSPPRAPPTRPVDHRT